MAESVFEAVKQSITVREAAQMYGIEVNRSGMACCPFHDDKNPSMKLNEEYFYCFGCGATGDVIDFTARLYNLSPKEAVYRGELFPFFIFHIDGSCYVLASPCPFTL